MYAYSKRLSEGVKSSMTDGIIQEVFKDYKQDIRLTWFGQNFLLQIEQELIKKIKQEYLGYSDKLTKQILIGDNQE